MGLVTLDCSTSYQELVDIRGSTLQQTHEYQKATAPPVNIIMQIVHISEKFFDLARMKCRSEQDFVFTLFLTSQVVTTWSGRFFIILVRRQQCICTMMVQ